jgi:hypothetical protein
VPAASVVETTARGSANRSMPTCYPGLCASRRADHAMPITRCRSRDAVHAVPYTRCRPEGTREAGRDGSRRSVQVSVLLVRPLPAVRRIRRTAIPSQPGGVRPSRHAHALARPHRPLPPGPARGIRAPRGAERCARSAVRRVPAHRGQPRRHRPAVLRSHPERRPDPRVHLPLELTARSRRPPGPPTRRQRSGGVPAMYRGTHHAVGVPRPDPAGTCTAGGGPWSTTRRCRPC